MEEVEEDLEQEEDEGVAIEPFNLEAERREGHFDDGGHYVENAPDDDDKDAWLTTDGAFPFCWGGVCLVVISLSRARTRTHVWVKRPSSTFTVPIS